MALSTNDIVVPGMDNNNTKKNEYKGIVPGNWKAKINKFELWTEHWKPDNGLFLVMRMETAKPSPDFEGYPIDENDPDGPKHEGYTGAVKFSTWAAKDKYDARKGKMLTRDAYLLEDLLRLCVQLECVDWFKAAHNKYETIEEWVEAFNNDAPFKDKYLNVCIGGEQYVQKQSGKVKTGLHFVKYEKVDGTYYNAFGNASRKGNIVEYDEEKHYKKVAQEEVDSFDITAVDDAELPDTTTLDDITVNDLPFDLDPGFDL